MYFEDVFNVKRQEGARVAGELYINKDFQFLCQVFLIDDEIWIYFRRGKVDYRHDCEEEEDCDRDDRDAGAWDCSFAVLTGHSLIEVDGFESSFEAGEHEIDYKCYNTNWSDCLFSFFFYDSILMHKEKGKLRTTYSREDQYLTDAERDKCQEKFRSYKTEGSSMLSKHMLRKVLRGILWVR